MLHRAAVVKRAYVELRERTSYLKRRALDCYVTYQQTIEEAGARRNIPREAVFEIYQEAYDPPLESLVGQLADRKVSER